MPTLGKGYHVTQRGYRTYTLCMFTLPAQQGFRIDEETDGEDQDDTKHTDTEVHNICTYTSYKKIRRCSWDHFLSVWKVNYGHCSLIFTQAHAQGVK